MKSIIIGDGEDCVKCGTQMQRKAHHPKESIHTNYHFTWWDYCIRCQRVQHYQQNMVRTVEKKIPSVKELLIRFNDEYNNMTTGMEAEGCLAKHTKEFLKYYHAQ